MSVEDEINEIEKYIKSLEINDSDLLKINEMIKEGTEKGLIYDFVNTRKSYRGTIYSSKIIKQEDYNEFQKYINRCEEEQQQIYKKWQQDIIDSGVEYSKDELKYIKLI
jgi:hypothetical protein